MDLTVLVNSARYLAPLGAGASYLVEAGGTRLLLDAANGTALKLRTPPDAVVASHYHSATVADLLPVLAKLERDAPVFVPERAQARLAEVAPTKGRLVGVGNGSRERAGELDLAFAKTHHGCPGVAARVEHGGRALAYLSDTGERPWLKDLARGADLVVAHTMLLDGEEDGERVERNLSAGAAARLASAAGARRLALLFVPLFQHRERAMAEARAHFAGEILALEEGRRYDV